MWWTHDSLRNYKAQFDSVIGYLEQGEIIVADEREEKEYAVSQLKEGVWVEGAERVVSKAGRKSLCASLRTRGYRKEGGIWKVRQTL